MKKAGLCPKHGKGTTKSLWGAPIGALGFGFLLSVFFLNSSVCMAGSEERTCLAYLDPGTGSMILQMLIGGIVAAGVVVKMFWYRVKPLFLRIIGKKVEETNDDD